MKTKYFDSKMYKTEKNIKTAFIILVVFLIRFISWCSNKLHGITKQRKRNTRISSRNRLKKSSNRHIKRRKE